MGGVAGLLGADDEDPRELIGRRLGAYRIEGVIASGGMGAVCLGIRDDDAFTMRVAIKLVRAGAGGSSGDWHDERLRRFDLERQVLAELEHPSIARLIDGGTCECGRPYLVMEHVDGLAIDAHCDRAKLSMTQRLRLFVRVCRAVQHAHQRLIIHRDLKPSNILVTPEGDPKLLDFGLAKLLDTHRAALRSAHTQAGQFMGTIAYAAPEQVSGSARDQDARTDVYALGMILYRLIAGRSAYTTDGSMSEVLDRITRVVPPQPSSVNPRVGRELDTIVMKTLAKDRDARYQSAVELGDDVERLLAGKPVRARGAGRWYVLRKAAWRHRVGVGTVAGLLVLALGVAVTMSAQAARLADREVELVAALRASNIERARTLGATGSTLEAEQVLWSELLASLEGAPVRDRLADGDPSAYWALWELYARDPCRWTTPAPGASDAPARLSSDGACVLVRTGDGPSTLFRARTGEAVGVVPARAGEVGAACVVDANSVVWYATPSGEIVRWQPGGTDGVIVARTGLDEPTGLCLGPSHQVLVWSDSQAAIVSLDAPERVRRIDIETARIRNLAMSPDGWILAVAADDGYLRLYDADTATLAAKLLEPERWTSQLAFSPGGRYLATDVNGADVVVVDVRTRAVVARLTDASGWIATLQFHPDRTEPALLLASSADKSAYIWEAPSGRLVRRLAGHATPLYDAVFDPVAGRVVTLGGDAIRAWDLDTDTGVTRWADPDTVFDAKFTPDGKRILTSSGDRRNVITVRDARTGRVERVLSGHAGAVTTLAISPDGRSVVSGSFDGSIRAWDLGASGAEPTDGRQIAANNPEPAVVNSVDISPDGALIAWASDDGRVRVHRVADGVLVEDIHAGPNRVPSVGFSPDGRWLAMAVARTNVVLLRDLRTGENRTIPAHAQTIRVVAFSPDGSVLASAGDDLAIRLWDLRPGRVGSLERALAGHRADVFALAFAPDGTMLASAGRDGDVKLWDAVSGRCLATLDAHNDMIFTLAFSPDGRTLVSAGRDQTNALWRLDAFDEHFAGNAAYFGQVSGKAR
ncbi:MAG: hypothetical protein DHS20C14_11730 [Phycisphaeraceae bacterium]|nr:MAG: hypothetical protein DHS20C14_11730 [Phycisphaeraceae bacterium]